MNQLARRVPGLELDPDVVQTQVKAFKAAEAAIVDSLKKVAPSKRAEAPSEESSVAKLIEEMKSLPSRVAERLSEESFPPRRKPRRFHPMMFEELLHFAGEPGDPVGILLAASLVREDMPWLYELSMEVYRAVKNGGPEAAERELAKIHRISEMMLHSSFMDEFGRKEHHLIAMEFPRLLERTLRHAIQLQHQPVLKRARQTTPSKE